MHYNVLPPEIKQELRNEYRLRLITLSVFAFGIVTILFAVSLLPAYIVVSSKASRIQDQTAALQKLKQNDTTAQVVAALAATKEKIDALSVPGPVWSASQILQKVASASGENVTIESVLYQPQGSGHSVVVTGVATTREALLALQNNLEHTTPFLKADIPVDQLAKSSKVAFTITVTGNF